LRGRPAIPAAPDHPQRGSRVEPHRCPESGAAVPSFPRRRKSPSFPRRRESSAPGLVRERPPPPSGGVAADGARRGPATVAVRGCARGLPRKSGPADTRNITPSEFAARGQLSGQTDVASMSTYAWLGSLSLRSHAVPAGPLFRAPPTRARTAHRLPRRSALRPSLAPEQVPCRSALQFSAQHQQHAALASFFPGHQWGQARDDIGGVRQAAASCSPSCASRITAPGASHFSR
jgi:hypothetical protein